MKLILVRHGETEWNVKHIVQGHKGVPLNRKGKSQARKVALHLRKEKIDVIYSSDLERARQTTAAIARFHKVPVIYTRLIRERKFGDMEGISIEEYKKVREKSDIPKYRYRPPGGGENYIDIRKRVNKFLAMLKKKHGKQTVLVVSHGGLIRTIVAILTKKPFEDIYEIEHYNASVSVIELRRGSPPKIHYLNSTEHL
jgi:broad specificity phosphatase PhoE